MSEISFSSCNSAPCSPKTDRKGIRRKSTSKTDCPALQGMTKKWRIRRTSSVHVENPSKQLVQPTSSKKMQLEDCTFNFSFLTNFTQTPLEIEFSNLNLNTINSRQGGRTSLSVGSSPITPRKEPTYPDNNLFTRNSLIKSASNLTPCTFLKQSSSDSLEGDTNSEPSSPFGSPSSSPSPVNALLERVEIHRPAVSLPSVTALLKSIDDRNCNSCSCPHHCTSKKQQQHYHQILYGQSSDDNTSWNQQYF